MKQLLAFLFFFCSIGNAIATDNGEFDYSSNGSYITINKYIGSRECKEVIVPKQIENLPVTQINRILGQDPSKVEYVYIPANVIIKGNINNSQTTIKCGVIDYDFTLYNETAHPFYYSSVASTPANLECIYTFGETIHSEESLVGAEKDKLFHLGLISITYSDKSYDYIQLYNWTADNSIAHNYNFDDSRLEHLIWALEQHLVYKDLSLNDIVTIDFRGLNVTEGDKHVIYTFNKDPLSLFENGVILLFGNDEIHLKDLSDYYNPIDDLSGTIHYFRNNTQDWNSVCLPFALYEKDFPEDSNTKIYTISGADEERIKLTHVESVAAGEPCFIRSEAENWNLSLTNREIKSSTQAGTKDIEGWKMFGSFTWKIIGADKYKLNEDGKSISPTANDDAHVSPFRCYLECTSASGAPERFAVSIEGEEQSITFTKEDSDTTDLIYFDLMGHPIQNNDEPRMLKGRNIIIR